MLRSCFAPSIISLSAYSALQSSLHKATIRIAIEQLFCPVLTISNILSASTRGADHLHVKTAGGQKQTNLLTNTRHSFNKEMDRSFWVGLAAGAAVGAGLLYTLQQGAWRATVPPGTTSPKTAYELQDLHLLLRC